MVHRGEITQAKLEVIYGVIQKIIKNGDFYYTSEQITELKQNPNNIFLKKEGKNEYNFSDR